MKTNTSRWSIVGIIKKRYVICPKHFLYFVLCGLLSEIAFLTWPYLLQQIIDNINKGVFNNMLLLIWGLWFMANMFDMVAIRIGWTIQSYITNKIKTTITEQYYNIISKKNSSEIQEIGTGKLQTRVNNWIDAEISLLTTFWQSIQSIGMRAIFVIIIFSYKLPALNLLFIGLLIIITISHKLTKSYIEPRTKQITKINEESWKLNTKIIMEHQTVSLCNKESFEISKLKTILSPLPKLSRTTDMTNEIWYSLMELLFRSIELICYLYIWHEIIYSGTYTIGEMIMITTYIWRLWRPTSTILNNLSSIRKQRYRFTKLQLFIEKENKIPDWNEHYHYKKWEISINNIDFSYATGDQLFKNFSILFESKKTTAIVWHSWWGKSSLIKLILRQYVPQYGDITIDWQVLNNLSKESRYDAIGYISQETNVFDWTIKENLLYASPEAQYNALSSEEIDEMLRWALKKVHLDKLILSKKNWLLTKVGERGIKLSWGEKQRLSLARLFIKNPPIIILDEPTSALDSLSEDHIVKSLQELTKNKTVIVIAHRLQTVMNADKIIVIEKWTIVEQWTHNNLIQQWGTYSQLVDLQNWTLHE